MFLRSFLGLVCAIMLLAGLASAQPADKTKIAISGSDTMNLLTQRLAEEYMKLHPEVQISVRGGGSGVGIKDLVEGLVDVAQASRKIEPEEITNAESNGYHPEEHVAALDGIAVAVNANNPVKELSINQIGAIYTGAVTRWNQLDPSFPDAPIVVFSRESSSGTYHFFKEHVMKKKDFVTGTSFLAATAAVANSVANDKNSIGFGGVAYFVRTSGIHVLAVKKDKGSPAVSPVTATGHVDFAAIQNGSYPISRPLQYYTRQRAEGEIAKFLDWIISAKGQELVAEMEYIPLGK